MDADQALAALQRIYTRLDARRSDIIRFEDYHEGKQPLSFATEEWRKANAERYIGFSDNWARPVVDAEVERIHHTGIKIADNKEAARLLWGDWLYNEMEAQSAQGWVTTLTTSRTYAIVWADENGDPQIDWEHPSNVEIEYDWSSRRRRTAAVKSWVDETTEYATLYEPEAVWKFQRPRIRMRNDRESQAQQAQQRTSGDGGWVPRLVRGEVWPLVNPIGVVPVVEFPNRPLLAKDPISEIHGVVPMQDAINLLWAYLFLAADYASMPARVVLHQGPPKMPILDKDGQKIGERDIQIKDLSEKRMLYLSGQNTDIKQWDPARVDVFSDVIETAVGHIAAQTRTPPTYLVSKTGMSNVNGQGLKASEIGLVKKTIEFETFATPAIRELYRLCALVRGQAGLASLVRQATIAWANPEIRSEAELADALQKKRAIGYPVEYLLELDGVSPEDIDRIMAMREQEAQDPQITQAMRQLGGGAAAVEEPVPDEAAGAD